MMITRLAALAAAALLACAPAAAQVDVRTLPVPSSLAGTERSPAVQGAGCATRTSPCASVAITPDLLRTYLGPTFQPRDADLDAIAALATTGYGRELLTRADAAALRSYAGLGTAAVASTGTSGATVPLLNTANSWSARQTLAAAPVVLSGSVAFPGAASATAFAYRSDSLGFVLYGAGTEGDLFLGNRSGSMALAVDPNGTGIAFGGSVRPSANNAQTLGTAARTWSSAFAREFRPGTGAQIWTSGAGSPAGAVTAPVGSLYTRTDGGAGTTLYVKETGTDANGWTAK